jgi:ubiquinone/menaquinone biosynthesis C-methylase UbiE
MEFENVYEDLRRAEAYARLEFPGTYYLAYRDLPEIISKHIRGINAFDFGCGTGRSTRFLKKMGFNTTGVDISEDMLKQARSKDRSGDYHIVNDADLSRFDSDTVDLVLSAFTFDNVPSKEKKVGNLRELKRLLRPDGKIINLVSSPDIYIHEWASFSTRDFPENRGAKSGDKVKIVMTDVEDQRPVEDILWSDDAYREIYNLTRLNIAEVYRPLAKPDEPFDWVNETRVAPWVIYVLVKA